MLWLGIAVAAAVLLFRFCNPWYALIPATIFALLLLIFRDPDRPVSSIALGVFSPVDGEVVEVGSIDVGETGAPALRVVIRINSLGTYTARSPVEGIIKDLGKNVLWLQTDEGADVVLKFSGYRFGLAPKSFGRFGERFGQGHRCAYLRLVRFAEVQLPGGGRILVAPGQRVTAGAEVIGRLPSPR